MNKNNKNNIAKNKDGAKRFRETEKRVVAAAAAASFVFTLTSCSGSAHPMNTLSSGTEDVITSWTQSIQEPPFDFTEKAPEQTLPSELPDDSNEVVPPEDESDTDTDTGENTDMGNDIDSDSDTGSDSDIDTGSDNNSDTDTDTGTDTDTDTDTGSDVAPVVEVRTSILFETIPFQTIYVNDPDMYDDESFVRKEGVEGRVKVTIYSTYIDGVLDSTKKQRETQYFSQNRVIVRGTKPSVTTEEKTVEEIAEKYSTIYEECDTMEIGTTKIKTEGKNAVATRTYLYTYTRGELTSRELISESISERVDEVVLVGTKEPEKVTDTTFGMPFIDAAHGGVDYSVTQDFGSGHSAIDFGVYYGDPIVASMSGTVIAAYDEGYFSKDNILWTYGTYVVIQHDGYRTYYAHLSSRTVSIGDTVEKGQVIGYSGNTGRVNSSSGGPYAGTHLHFEIRKYYPSLGVYHTVDPALYLPWWN